MFKLSPGPPKGFPEVTRHVSSHSFSDGSIPPPAARPVVLSVGTHVSCSPHCKSGASNLRFPSFRHHFAIFVHTLPAHRQCTQVRQPDITCTWCFACGVPSPTGYSEVEFEEIDDVAEQMHRIRFRGRTYSIPVSRLEKYAKSPNEH